MFMRSFKHLFAACLAAASLGTWGKAPAERVLKTFDQNTWAQLQTQAHKPFVTVFTTTDCAHCPAVVESLAATLKARKTPLYVVVMDGSAKPESVLSTPYYRKAQALYVFEGQAAALRYSVNPQWRGVTPYVALTPSKGATHYVMGQPSRDDLARLQP